MKKEKLGAASIGMIAGFAVAQLASVLYNRVQSSRLGTDFAPQAALVALINILGNTTLGLNTYLVKAFSEDAELAGAGAVKGRLLRLLKPGLKTLVVAGVVMGLAAPLIASYLKLPTVTLPLIVVVVVLTSVVMVALRAAVQGLHHFGWLSTSTAGEGLTRLGFVASPLSHGVAGGLWAYVVGQVMGLVLAVGGLLGLGKAKKPVRFPRGRKAVFKAVGEGAGDTLALTLLSLLGYLDVLVLKHHYPDDRAAIYFRAALVAKSFLYLPTALNVILLAAAAREIAGRRDPRRIFMKFLGAAFALDVIGLAGVWLLTSFCLMVVAGRGVEITPQLLDLTRWFSLAVIPLGLVQMGLTYLLAIRHGGAAWAMAVLAGVYFTLLQFTWDSEYKVVATLAVCSAGALAWTLWAALSEPPKRLAREAA